ncbi:MULTISPECIES: HipA domain-containing protein [unclassified Stappia]|uniref:HipA domain-containing protein n=1 Tax=unclassified Stappia TaxID=2629676 RepID=UPI001643BC21|nr:MULTISPECIES: HipA domain-containing protein [unclassified Stappia]
MTERALAAYINAHRVGELVDTGGVWSFRYAAGWLQSPGAYFLSPHLVPVDGVVTDGSSQRPVQWYFDNLLPEEGQRSLLASDASIDEADAFGLLAHYGAESVGSLTLVPPEQLPDNTGERRPLTFSALSERIRGLPRLPLTHAAPKRMSLAGAQHKLAVNFDGEALFEPVGETPSTHILKPDHPDPTYAHSVANEYFIMRLAARLRLQVPRVAKLYIPEPVYLIERFDRRKAETGWERLHVVDACQLLNLDRAFKYNQGSIERLAELANHCRSMAVARSRLFEWLVFNVLAGNDDAHLKNLSFLVSGAGVQLAPHYDLLCTAVYDSRAFDQAGWPDRTTLAWPVLGARRHADISREKLLDAAEALGLARRTGERILAFQFGRILAVAQELQDEIEAEDRARYADDPKIQTCITAEARTIRAVIHTVIADTVRQLG